MPKLGLHSAPGENSLAFNAASHFRAAKKAPSPWLSLGCACSPAGSAEPSRCGGGAARAGLFSLSSRQEAAAPAGAWRSGRAYRALCLGSQAVEHPGWDVFCLFITAVCFLSACLSAQSGARGSRCVPAGNSPVFPRGCAGSANALRGFTPGKEEWEAGKAPAGSCCASAKKPK